MEGKVTGSHEGSLVIGLIPSRMGSQRLPGKALAEIAGIPVVVHVAKRSQMSEELDKVVVCTDSEEIIDVCHQYDIETILTSNKHVNGTERIAEAACGLEAELFIDIQGDEPLVNPTHINTVARYMRENSGSVDVVIPTLEVPYSSADTIVRVQKACSGRVMTLTRAMVPHRYVGTVSTVCKHLSVIGLTKKALRKYTELRQTPNEEVEGIELLRAVENDMRVYCISVSGDSFSVDVYDDLVRARAAMLEDPVFQIYKDGTVTKAI